VGAALCADDVGGPGHALSPGQWPGGQVRIVEALEERAVQPRVHLREAGKGWGEGRVKVKVRVGERFMVRVRVRGS